MNRKLISLTLLIAMTLMVAVPAVSAQEVEPPFSPQADTVGEPDPPSQEIQSSVVDPSGEPAEPAEVDQPLEPPAPDVGSDEEAGLLTQPEGAYVPRYDVNGDGIINVLDLQLVGGSWASNGTYVSDNNHDHLGQEWIGTSSLVITGSFGFPNYAPLVLGNTAGGGDGLRIESTADHGVYVVSAADSGVQIGYAGDDAFFASEANDRGLYIGTAGGDGVWVNSAGEHGVYAKTTSADHYGGYFYNSASGGVGLRALGGDNQAPDIILGGNTSASDDGRIHSDPSYTGSDIFLTSNDAVVVELDADGGGEDADFEIRNKDATVIFNVDDSGQVSIVDASGTETVEILPTEGSTGGQITLRKADGTTTIEIDAEYGAGGNGRITTEVLQITGGSDLSEQFEVRSSLAGLRPTPGMVVCIDTQRPGELVVCQNSYDHTVAGVISGAGGVKPGMLMSQAGSEADGRHPVALTGRVYVLADASQGAIQPGDLLTTADLAGHAMKANDYGKAQGAILGKAMTSLSEGQGLVLVLVSLQ